MSTSMAHLTIDDLKAQAKRLRQAMSAAGTPVGHSRALELVAKSHGVRDWNTLAALASRHDNAPLPPASVGALVSGEYLGQRFTGKVLALQQLSDSDFYAITLHFDEPVDVVTFDSFSAFRQRVNGTIDRKGVSPRQTSNGRPQIVLDR
ncbi:glyoxalase superfamily protein [Agrobacterium sp. ES01]|uniref:glyoxalase superfamily protein n=1 Tax=Agrobacterium sp. ES01 TaxID=3420714 RepID=UPI003D0DBC6E